MHVSTFHDTFAHVGFVLVNSQYLTCMVLQYLKPAYNHLRGLLKKSYKAIGCLAFFASYTQMLSWITTAAGVCQPSEFANCFGHFSVGSIFLLLGCWSILQTHGILYTNYSFDRILSMSILFIGILMSVIIQFLYSQLTQGCN
jgi:hypothetical protein